MDQMMGSELLYAKIFARAPIYDIVLSCLSPRALFWVARTCRIAYFAVAEFKGRAYNINIHLKRYFDHPIAFRSLQARTNTLVSGSNALQFLDRTFYPEADLDLYTHPGHSFEVAQFLAEVEGYEYVPRQRDEDDDEDPPQDWQEAIPNDWDGTETRVSRFENQGYPLKGIAAVWTFTKPGEHSRKVQIIETRSSPVEAILDFHSTCVMNFISSDAAYALYPRATFVERKSLCMPKGRQATRAIQKYVQRGWRVYFVPTPDDLADKMKPPFMLDAERWVGDAHTWVVPLDQQGVQARPSLSAASAPLTLDPVRCQGWGMKMHMELETNGYEAYSYPLQATVFRYNYGIPDEALWMTIRAWANTQGKMSHTHLLKEDWVWFDSDLPAFLPIVKS